MFPFYKLAIHTKAKSFISYICEFFVLAQQFMISNMSKYSLYSKVSLIQNILKRMNTSLAVYLWLDTLCNKVGSFVYFSFVLSYEQR